MADEFKPGDLVRLKSGGPPMTIEDIGTFGGPKDQAHCSWFSGNDRKRELFDLDILEKVTPSP